MTELDEIANVLNGTLQEETEYRGSYNIEGEVATFDITGFNHEGFATELTEGLNESDDSKEFTFSFKVNEEGKEIIIITKK